MASAQVMSNPAISSRKKDHLEAGKRRLEEFRKKKAAAKKAVSTSLPHSVVSTALEKHASQNGDAQFVGSVGAAANGKTDLVSETSTFLNHDNKLHDLVHINESESVLVVDVNPESHPMQPKQNENSHYMLGLKPQTGFIYSKQIDDSVSKFGTDADAIVMSSSGHNAPHSQDDHSSYFNPSIYEGEVSHSNKDRSFPENPTYANASINVEAAQAYVKGQATNISLNGEPDSSHLILAAHASGFDLNQHLGLEKNQLISGLGNGKPGNDVHEMSSFYSQQAFKPLSEGVNSDGYSSFNVPSYLIVPETHPRRSRPSFLDALNIRKESLGSDHPYSQKEKFATSEFSTSSFVASSIASSIPDHFTPPPAETLPTLVPTDLNTDFDNAFRGHKLFNSLESKLEPNFQKHNEDFAALEQHIEDLTQEKFSLQRALESSKTLAESLAAENSSLTESYNQQASIVNQLKDEMEKLHGEIKARLVELESFKAEYMNAQLECNAADERAKLLASEVIGLEEKALRLRSNELKLERELENSSAEIASYKKKLSSLEKERRDLLQTIDALQEEKKLLQAKFRRASAGGVSVDISKGHSKKDVSTSTNDLGFETAGADGDSSQGVPSNAQVDEDADSLLVLAQCTPAGFEDSAMSIPPDQMQMVHNINSLMSEIIAEKEELMKALVSEVSKSTQLKDLNKELSQKLEVQTQRLELLTSQSMVNESVSSRQPASSHVARESIAYADEGDEVVERVLGWIMKLFPGGPSKRRTSRLS